MTQAKREGQALWRFVLNELPAEPWRNGAGSTRLIASRFDGPDLQWRISAADVTGPQPFSGFTGLNRTATLIKGAGVDLVEGPLCLRMRAIGDQATFPGEWLPQPELTDGPVQLWNVMTKRGHFDARVWLTTDETLQCNSGAVIVVLVLSGRYVVRLNDEATAQEPAVELQAGDGVVIESSEFVTVRPVGDGAGAVVTQVVGS